MDQLDFRLTFFSYDTVGFSDVLCRYSLGANPRGVTDSRFCGCIFALLLLVIPSLHDIIPSLWY